MPRLPHFSLASTDGSTVGDADLRGRPRVLYVARHLGCSICQARLRDVVDARASIEERGATLVVVLPADVDRARAWQRREAADGVTVLADPEGLLARALRTRRRSLRWVLHPRTLVEGVQALAGGRLPAYTAGDDASALGADVVVDADGRVVLLHRAGTAGDRRSPADLLGTLDALPPAAVPA